MRYSLYPLIWIGLLCSAFCATGEPDTPLPKRTPAPTRDPYTHGYVTATKLPDGAVPPVTENGNFILGTNHLEAAEFSGGTNILHGRVVDFFMESTNSNFYPGIAREKGTVGSPDPSHPDSLVVTTSHPAPYKRKVSIYVPESYVQGTAAPFILGMDGPDRTLFLALDRLIAAHKLPPLIGISVGNGGGDAQGSERGLEYDTLNGRFAEFIEQEVLPTVEKNAGVTLTKNPDGRAAMGVSSGAACAFTMAWYHPDLFRRVLSYSGTFVNQQWPHDPSTPHGAWGYHESLIHDSPAKPIRVWLEVGDRDLLNPNLMRDGMHDWVEANERMAQVLAEKGYAYQFLFVQNAGHGDRGARLQTMPEALEWLWQDYPRQ